MDNFSKFTSSLKLKSAAYIVLANIAVLSIYIVTYAAFGRNVVIGFGAALVATFILAAIVSSNLVRSATDPLKIIWTKVTEMKPGDEPSPDFGLQDTKQGRQLLMSLLAQIYELSTQAKKVAESVKIESKDIKHNFVAQNLPLPIVIVDKDQNIVFSNNLAADYIGIKAEDMLGKNVYMAIDMAFQTNDTFDKWLKDVTVNKATAYQTWERVKLNVRDGHPERLFDLAAYYNRNNPDSLETIMVLFDHTQAYVQDDQAVSFIALAVHELRTPLTLLRGYIEVFEEELGPSTTPELKDFMAKMRAMAEQLTDFVNNILNVARVEDDQLELRLQQEDWPHVLKSSIEQISLRAKVRGITLKCRMQTNLPPVGVDRISIREVISNLIDNALKYSGESKVIEVETFLNKEGLVETTVKDYGVGIPESVVANLFTKFYRDHRNRAQIGGTGLGLYLSKAIIDAHGGNIWVRSKEGEGSTFGFTILPFDKIENANNPNDEQSVTRSAHGWIKNHSLYRK